MRPLPPPAVTQSGFPLITDSHNHACYVYLGSLIASRDHCVLTPPPGISRQRRWTRDSKPPCPVLEPGLQLDRLYKAVWGEGEKTVWGCGRGLQLSFPLNCRSESAFLPFQPPVAHSGHFSSSQPSFFLQQRETETGSGTLEPGKSLHVHITSSANNNKSVGKYQWNIKGHSSPDQL